MHPYCNSYQTVKMHFVFRKEIQKPMEINVPIESVKGVGDKSRNLLKKINIRTVYDMLNYFPKDVQKYENPVESFKEIQIGELISIKGVIHRNSIQYGRNKKRTFAMVLFYGCDFQIQASFFHMPYLSKVLLPEIPVIFRGVVSLENDKLKMVQPKIIKVEEYSTLMEHLQPVYSLTQGITNHFISKTMQMILREITVPEDYMEELPENIRTSFYCKKDAFLKIHFPSTMDEFEQARKRFVFDEFLEFLLTLSLEETAVKRMPVDKLLVETADTKRLIEALPYELTGSQETAFNEIKEDMTGEYSMNRLLQGDVGSGKTILAFLALLLCASNNRQGCLMAPTEVLARQHFLDLEEMVLRYTLCIRPVLLIGSMKETDKRKIREDIKNGVYNCVIGTNAVMQDSVEYQSLSLVITDEQHRFGVNQRKSLAEKGNNPHVLVMSATPIPRTLAMILYGNLSISTLRELPKGRLPIKNCVVNESYRSKICQFMVSQLEKQHQIYVICPLIEDSGEEDEMESVLEYEDKLKNYIPSSYTSATLHGRMTLEEKNEIMQEFSEHKIDILIATTVIEVGINVPNATVILIENAERYGLSQLHQLRGRVGRGKDQSYCIFMNQKDSEKVKERLSVLEHSNDGFEIAEKDLALRGPGELYGVRQSGLMGFYVGDIFADHMELECASACVNELSQKDYSEKKEKIMQLLKIKEKVENHFRTI